MTPQQWYSIADKVNQLWGRSQKWAKADELASRVQALPYDVADRVVEDLMLEGSDHAPAPAKVIALTVEQTRTSSDIVDRLASEHCAQVGHLNATDQGVIIRCARCGNEPVDTASNPVTERIAP